MKRVENHGIKPYGCGEGVQGVQCDLQRAPRKPDIESTRNSLLVWNYYVKTQRRRGRLGDKCVPTSSLGAELFEMEFL